MRFKRQYDRMKINYLWKTQKRISLKDDRLSEEEHVLIKLIKKISVNPSTQILTAPVSNKRYIIDKDNVVFIIMEHNAFTIISDTSKLRFYLNSNISEYIWNFIDKEIEKRRKILENEIHETVSISLDKILKKYGE